jgi:formiminoglutamase
MSVDDPRWPRASLWLAGDTGPDAAARLSVLGVPSHLGSITPGRADLGPNAIRSALRRFSTWDFDLQLDIRSVAVRDFGDLDVAGLDPHAAFGPVVQGVANLGEAGAVALLGGDNSITRPGLHGLKQPLERCALLTLDAHLDLRDLDRLSNGNPVRALLQDGLPGANVAQVGIQSYANSPAYAQIAREAGIVIATAEHVHARGIAAVTNEILEHLSTRADIIYVDLDLDVMDRAFSPGTPGSRPGGLLPWQSRMAARMCGQHPKVRVIDFVELDPEQDIAEVTALAAAACLLSFASGLMMRP